MSFTVYALYSEKYGKHYYGFTSNLPARLLSHNELGSDWTANYRPWKIIYTKEFQSKKEAMLHEKWLKTGAGRDFIKSLPH
jgi:putative endonuclease